MGRESCLFTRLDAGKVPAKQRADFARMAVRRAAPFANPGFDIAWLADNQAAVWYWPQDSITALAGTVPGRRKRYVAEAMYLGQPIADGVELLSFAAGVEARAWKQQHLVASRYWPEPPTAAQWQDFLRGAGQDPAIDALPPAPQPLALRSKPWNTQASTPAALQLSGVDHYLPKILIGLAALVLLVLGVQLGSGMRAQVDTWQAQSAATQLDAPIQRILDARQASDTARADINQLLSLQGHPTTTLMAEVVRLMQGKKWQVLEWQQPTPDRLEIKLLAPDINTEDLVSTFEQSPLFDNVSTELSGNTALTIKMNISTADRSAPPAETQAEQP